ncbi:MAG: hypothetical protein ABW214_03050, partial [Terrimicrobiaceae bacterium]
MYSSSKTAKDIARLLQTLPKAPVDSHYHQSHNHVTGWITSAGGAWNASIVAEYVQHGGKTYNAFGLGDLISRATSEGAFDVLAAAVVVMA